MRSIGGIRNRGIVVPIGVLLLAGCQGLAPRTPVQLLTGVPDGVSEGTCYTAEIHGLLVVDARYGTAILDDTAPRVGGVPPSPLPVAWRPGVTGRLAGSEVEVVDPNGRVVATTGQRDILPGGYSAVAGVRAWWACGVWEGWTPR